MRVGRGLSAFRPPLYGLIIPQIAEKVKSAALKKRVDTWFSIQKSLCNLHNSFNIGD